MLNCFIVGAAPKYLYTGFKNDFLGAVYYCGKYVYMCNVLVYYHFLEKNWQYDSLACILNVKRVDSSFRGYVGMFL